MCNKEFEREKKSELPSTKDTVKVKRDFQRRRKRNRLAVERERDRVR